MGPSRVEPLYGKIFAARYGPSFGVQVWCPNVLTTYVVQVTKMVCFFEVAFENDLRFPLHPFIKRVLQHFNVCPSQLSPNFWGVLVGLLVAFRDKGLGVPSITLLLDFFSVKEAAESFLYLSKRSSAKLIMSDLPSSHKFWKERYFFVSRNHWEYNPFDREDTLGVPADWTTPENLRELSIILVCFGFQRSHDIYYIALVAWPSGVRPDLSLEDEELKRKLVKYAPRAYSELIRSDIPGSSSARAARLHFLRSSPISVMKPPVPKSSSPSVSKPLTAKLTWGELRFRLEVLEKKKRSVKRKPPSSPEDYPPARDKTLKVGTSPSPSSIVGARDSLRRADEPPFEVLPISVWSPTSRGAAPPPTMPDEVTGNRDCFEAVGDEDSLLSHAELTAGAVSSILRHSDLKRVGALPVE